MEELDSFETLKVTKDAKMSRLNATRMGAKASFFKIQSKDSAGMRYNGDHGFRSMSSR